MTEKIEPMTAAEYRASTGTMKELTHFGKRILAALEDREANLAHARLGSLVAAIREHPMRPMLVNVQWPESDATYGLSEAGFNALLRHLDSLLPKEPEVAPSGWRYEMVPVRNGQPCLVQCREGDVELTCFSGRDDVIPPIDREFVAALLARQEGKDAQA